MTKRTLNRLSKLIAPATIALWLAGGAGAMLASRISADDATVAAHITGHLRNAHLDSVNVVVAGKTATLTGTVDRLAKAKKAGDIARKIDGVGAVDNEIQVLSNRSDQQIAADVTHQIRNYPFYSIFDWITGTVNNGVVTLQGAVHVPVRSSDYANIAMQVPGVKAVNNQIEKLPTSIIDDQIRARMARAIYGRSGIVPLYANQALPPIHIIVKNGNVTLEGVVLNQLDKTLVERAARLQSRLYFGLQDNLVVEHPAIS